jgi:hypothetical protein
MAATTHSPLVAPKFERSEPPTYGLVLDPGQIAAYRDALVQPSGVREPTVLAINLEGRFPLTEVLHELIVPLAQAARSGSLGPLMLVICTPSAKLRDTLEALAEKHKLALFVAPSPDRVAEAEPIGDLTPTERQTLDTVRRLGGSVNVSAFAKAAGLTAPAATNRLVNVMHKGFMQRADRPRSEGVVYMDPHAVRVNEVPPQLPLSLSREVEIFAAVSGRSRDDLVTTAWSEWVGHGDSDQTPQALAQAWVAYRQRHSVEISDGLRWAQQVLSDPCEAGVQTSGMSGEDLQAIRDAFE